MPGGCSDHAKGAGTSSRWIVHLLLLFLVWFGVSVVVVTTISSSRILFPELSLPHHCHYDEKRQQLEELRRGAAAGDAALREAAKLKNLLEGALRSTAMTPSNPSAAAHTGAPPTAVADADAESVEIKLEGKGAPCTSDGRVGAASLVELADQLQRHAEDLGGELESTREALTTAR